MSNKDSTLTNALRGVSITTATPFNEPLSQVNTSGLKSNLEYLIREGGRLVIPCGNTGEFYSLSDDEWRLIVKTTMDTVSSRMLVMPGIGNSIRSAIDMLKFCEESGCIGVMVMYPQHVFRSEEGILRYYQEILGNAQEIDVVLYKKGPLLTDAVLEKLIGHPRVVGVKYASGRIVDFSRTVHRLGNDIVWSCGTAERFAPFFWLVGAEGFTTGLGNFAPRVSLKMYEALKSGNYETAMAVQHQIERLEFLREDREKANNVPVVKAAMDYIGLIGGECRPPIHPLCEEERRAVIGAISDWDIISP